VVDGGERLLERGDEAVELRVRDGERRLDAQRARVDVGAADQDLASKQVLRDRVTELVVGELEAEHEAAASPLLEQGGEAAAELGEPAEQVVALLAGLTRQVLLEQHVERRDRGGAGDRVAA